MHNCGPCKRKVVSLTCNKRKRCVRRQRWRRYVRNSYGSKDIVLARGIGEWVDIGINSILIDSCRSMQFKDDPILEFKEPTDSVYSMMWGACNEKTHFLGKQSLVADNWVWELVLQETEKPDRVERCQMQDGQGLRLEQVLLVVTWGQWASDCLDHLLYYRSSGLTSLK